MRRIVTFNRLTADGYFADPEGRLGWIVPDESLDREAAAATASPGGGTILFGRRTFDFF